MKMRSLQRSLSQFGLNPSDWVLIPVQAHCLVIKNRHDSAYQLLGHIHNNKWSKLELISI